MTYRIGDAEPPPETHISAAAAYCLDLMSNLVPRDQFLAPRYAV